MSNNKHYVYILKCKKSPLSAQEDDKKEKSSIFYVGETSWLSLRMDQHFNHQGGATTSFYKPKKVVAVYDIDDLIDFFAYDRRINYYLTKETYCKKKEFINMALTYYRSYDKMIFDSVDDNLNCENFIAERIILHLNGGIMTNVLKIDNIPVRGGQYTPPIGFESKWIYTPIFCQEKLETLPVCKCGLPCTVRLHKDGKDVYFKCAKIDLSSAPIKNNIAKQVCDFNQIYDKPYKLYSKLKKCGVKIIDTRAK